MGRQRKVLCVLAVQQGVLGSNGDTSGRSVCLSFLKKSKSHKGKNTESERWGTERERDEEREGERERGGGRERRGGLMGIELHVFYTVFL